MTLFIGFYCFATGRLSTTQSPMQLTGQKSLSLLRQINQSSKHVEPSVFCSENLVLANRCKRMLFLKIYYQSCYIQFKDRGKI